MVALNSTSCLELMVKHETLIEYFKQEYANFLRLSIDSNMFACWGPIMKENRFFQYGQTSFFDRWVLSPFQISYEQWEHQQTQHNPTNGTALTPSFQVYYPQTIVNVPSEWISWENWKWNFDSPTMRIIHWVTNNVQQTGVDNETSASSSSSDAVVAIPSSATVESSSSWMSNKFLGNLVTLFSPMQGSPNIETSYEIPSVAEVQVTVEGAVFLAVITGYSLAYSVGIRW